MRGIGPSVTSKHPDATVADIRANVTEALQSDLAACRLSRPDVYRLEIALKDQLTAYRGTFYPGVEALDQNTLAFAASDFFDILRAIKFLLY